MISLPLLAAASVVVLGLASAVASARTARRTAATLKMAAATGYLLLATFGGAFGSGYGRVVFLALALCWVGDLLLIAPGRGMAFLAGLGAFLLGHVAYVWAFWIHGIAWGWTALGLAGAGVVGVAVSRWLARHDVPDEMQLPVKAYVTVITLMVATAVGTQGAGGSWMLPTGALLFMASDIFVARERFVTLSSTNVLVGLPLYFAGQVLIALTV